MPSGKTKCPICKGTGKVSETTDYEFVTRDPETSRCLICDGSGLIASRTKLPDGTFATRLNVSKKARSQRVDIGIDTTVPKSVYKKQKSLKGAQDPRLSKVMASGARYMIVTESDPYYLAVCKLIREIERKRGTWTEANEEAYVQALEHQLMKYQGVSNG